MDWRLIHSVFLPLDRLWVYCDLNQDEEVTEDEQKTK